MLWKWRSKNGSDITYPKIFLEMRDRRLAKLVLNKSRSNEQK